MLLDNLFVILYAITLIISIARYRRYYDSALKYLPMIIGYTLINEILGGIIKHSTEIQIVYSEEYSYNNNLIFNIWDIVFFLYFFYVYWKVIRNTTHKTIIKYATFLYIATSIINCLTQDFLIFPQIQAIVIGSIVMILSSLLYFLDLKQNPIPVQKSRNLMLWISLGLLLFYSLYPFIMICITYHFNETYKAWHIRPIHLSAIITMYSLFIIGFVRMRRMRPLEI